MIWWLIKQAMNRMFEQKAFVNQSFDVWQIVHMSTKFKIPQQEQNTTEKQ